jgi:hypothetical protein
VEAVLVLDRPPELRDASLIALHALKATHRVVPHREHDLSRRELDRRAESVAEGDWGSKAVRHAIDAATATVIAATVAATSAATSRVELTVADATVVAQAGRGESAARWARADA